ncbi:hypothetical protein CXF85_15355 [Colwellia sp. 75C3]|uniref:hypothetical protein n=1 Tax=Colwellia sp. 75C3 TaxID=888425 RepID=UPI000C31F4EF|nr:hypothetical protein [Colwellia sp. 75C3]PKG81912.1 hypothetical protein CXF85_15355 [Colwellia sp. 75C3]
MKSKRIHRIIGLLLVLPVIGWTFTGIVFFIKPGYQAAYDQLAVKTYPLEKSFIIPESKEWTEVRLLKTILGYHLLVKTKNGFEHLDPISLQSKEIPAGVALNSLFNDSFLNKSDRYGQVISRNNFKVITSKGIEVSLNWERLTLRQKGEDTRLINTLYKIHYLQWTPYKGINQYMGIIGLILLMTLTLFGLKIYISGRHKNTPIK